MYLQGYSDMFYKDENYYGNRGYLDEVRSEKKLKVVGRGEVSVKPDIAEVIIGVVTENEQLDVAQQVNSNTTQKVIESIKARGILPNDIQTQNYFFNIVYDFIDGKRVFRGYEVTNNLKVIIRNINDVGKLIDTAVKNGANNISFIGFKVSNPSKYYEEALKLAVDDAQKKAISIADTLKVKLNIVPVEINELSRGNIGPLYMDVKSASLSTPIEAGENKITADVEAIFNYSE